MPACEWGTGSGPVRGTGVRHSPRTAGVGHEGGARLGFCRSASSSSSSGTI